MTTMRVRRAVSLMMFAMLCGGCAEPAPVASAPAVAWVGRDTLDAEALGRLLVLAQPFPLEAGAAVDLARHWQVVTALANAPERVETAAAAALDAALGDARVAALRAARFSDPVREAEAAAAAVYAAGELRLVGHILRRADAAARGEERAVQRRSAETILASLRAGGAWAAANERNEDDAARAAGGIIGLVARGDLPPPLDSVAFALAPGAYSDVIETGAGFHVMVRPSFGAARAEFTAQLATRRAEVQELELGADAAERRGAALAPIATVRIREVATDPWGALAATDAIGRFEGGALTGGALAAELAALSWDARRALADAPAQVREAFAGRALVRRVLHVEAADTPVEAEDSARTAAALRAQLDTILGRVAPPAGADARAAVDRYMGRIAARHVPLVMPPPAVWPALLRPDDAGFRLAAVTAALERARALLVAGGYTGGGR